MRKEGDREEMMLGGWRTRQKIIRKEGRQAGRKEGGKVLKVDVEGREE